MKSKIIDKITIKDVNKLVSILDTFSQLDDIRWSTSDNYNLINYCHDKLTNDEKLLTHWLCYITDRQMPFQRIWDVGGYVISHLARAFSKEGIQNVQELLISYVLKEDGKYSLQCPLETENTRLKRYGFTVDKVNKVKFASRYMPGDLIGIYRTLEIFDIHYKRSLACFLMDSFHREDNNWDAIRRMATALDRLTYAVEKVSAEEFKPMLKKMSEEAADFQQPKNIKKDLFKRKRLWCSLRDYLKSPEFNQVFVDALKDNGMENAERWERTKRDVKEALEAVELPGDVWNNSEVFREGIFKPYLESSLDMPPTIRRVYESLKKDHDLQFYPEQLDVTFDFVPRMCQRNMCDVCLFGKKGIEQICHRKPGCICSVALTSCGYRQKCNPEKCRLKEDRVKGFCRNLQ